MLQTNYISDRYFTKDELKSFRNAHGFDVTEISYSSAEGEIDFSNLEEKEFLLKYGTPKILARFGY